MSAQRRRPDGLLDRVIQAGRGACCLPDGPETMEDVAELLAHDGAGGVDQARRTQADQLLRRWREARDLDARDTGQPQTVVGLPAMPGLKVPVWEVPVYEVWPSAVAVVAGWLESEGLWPKEAGLWAGQRQSQTGPTLIISAARPTPALRVVQRAELELEFPRGFRKPDGTTLTLANALKGDRFTDCKKPKGNGYVYEKFLSKLAEFGWEPAHRPRQGTTSLPWGNTGT